MFTLEKVNILERKDIMQKELRLSAPVIDGFAGYASMNNMILHDEKGKDWFIQNYMKILTFYSEKMDTIYFDYANVDTLYVTSNACFQPDQLVNWPITTYAIPVEQVEPEELIDYIKKQIDLGYYVYIFLNWKYLKEYGHTTDAYHEIFFYGYDDAEEVLKATGYVKGRSYGEVTHSYWDVTEAYRHMDIFYDNKEENIINRDLARISLLRFKENFNFTFSIVQFVTDLKMYLNIEKVNSGIGIVNHHYQGAPFFYAYGNQMYDVLACFIKNKCNEGKVFDIREPYFLYNYLEGFMYKLKLLREKGILADDSYEQEYKAIVKKGKAFFFTAMEYVGKVQAGSDIDEETGEKMEQQLMEIKAEEKAVLMKFIKEFNLKR